MKSVKQLIFFGLALFCLHPVISPGLALITGFVVSLLSLNPVVDKCKRPSKLLIAWSIIGLGMTVKLSSIISLSMTYFWLTLSGIILTVGCGIILGRVLKISPVISALIASGTAICGASAIAAVGTAITAKAEELSMALGVVLILNTVALYLFPAVGHALLLSPHDFGVWAGLAIHDTSSVVGAALQYSQSAVETATTVKLARAIWIAPLAVLFGWILAPKEDRKLSFKLPWFIWGYLLAASLVTIFPMLGAYSEMCGTLARKGFVLGLFLTGSIIDIKQLKNLGPSPIFLGVILWILSSLWSLSMLLYYFS